MKVGHLYRLRDVKTYYADGKSFIVFKAKDKNRVGVFVFLGSEPRVAADDSKDVNAKDVMRALGWVLLEDVKEALGSEQYDTEVYDEGVLEKLRTRMQASVDAARTQQEH